MVALRAQLIEIGQTCKSDCLKFLLSNLSVAIFVHSFQYGLHYRVRLLLMLDIILQNDIQVRGGWLIETCMRTFDFFCE